VSHCSSKVALNVSMKVRVLFPFCGFHTGAYGGGGSCKVCHHPLSKKGSVVTGIHLGK